MNLPDMFFNSFDFDVGSYTISVPYFQAGAIIFLIFLLIITLAQVRHHYLDWSLKGALFGVFIGFVLTIILEGFLLIFGKTALISFFGWSNAPKPISVLLDSGREKLSNVLGESTKESGDNNDILKIYQQLPPDEAKNFSRIICQ